MNSKIIQITSPGSAAGNVAYTGVGFTPKAIWVVGGGTALGDQATMKLGLGAAASSSQRAAGSIWSVDASATSNVGNGRSATAVIGVRNAAGTLQDVADLVSFDSDGFTLNWTTSVSARSYHVLCIGGADVSAAVGFLCGWLGSWLGA